MLTLLCDETERNYKVFKVTSSPLYSSANRAKVRMLADVKQVQSCWSQGAAAIVQGFRLCAIMQKSFITSCLQPELHLQSHRPANKTNYIPGNRILSHIQISTNLTMRLLTKSHLLL